MKLLHCQDARAGTKVAVGGSNQGDGQLIEVLLFQGAILCMQSKVKGGVEVVMCLQQFWSWVLVVVTIVDIGSERGRQGLKLARESYSRKAQKSKARRACRLVSNGQE